MAGTSDAQAAWQGLSLRVHVVEGWQCEAATPSPEPVVSTWPQCPDTDPDASGCRTAWVTVHAAWAKRSAPASSSWFSLKTE